MNYLVNRKNNLDLFKDAWLNDLFGEPVFTKGYNNLMKTDIVENESNYELNIEMPGFEKENIKVSLEDGNLTIEGSFEKKENNEPEKAEQRRFIRKERFQGAVSRTYYIGDAVTNEDITASFKNGVLTVMVPKKDPVEKEKKTFININ